MATHKRWDGATWTAVSAIKRWDGSAWVDVAAIKRWDGTTWVDTAWGGGGGDLSATVSPGDAHGEGNTDRLVEVVVSNTVTTTPSGGTGPYTYAWTRVSGSASIQATAPTAATSAFLAGLYDGTTKTATFRCTVTDSLAATATIDVPVTLVREPI